MSKIEQFRLPPPFPHPERIIVSLEGVQIGSPAAKVLETIASCFPGIKSFEYAVYDVKYEDLGPNLPTLEWDGSAGLLFKPQRLPRTQVFYNLLRDISESIYSGHCLGISSRVLLESGKWAHIPMMDLVCKKGENNLEEAATILGGFRLGSFRGFILDSGNSYHFWGLDLLSEKEWSEFLTYCGHQRLRDSSPLFDEQHIEFSRTRGFSVLRIFAEEDKPFEPQVVRILG